MVFVILEGVVRWLQSKPFPRTNDSINSMTAGLLMNLCKIIIGTFEVSYAREGVACLEEIVNSIWDLYSEFLSVG